MANFGDMSNVDDNVHGNQTINNVVTKFMLKMEASFKAFTYKIQSSIQQCWSAHLIRIIQPTSKLSQKLDRRNYTKKCDFLSFHIYGYFKIFV